MARDPGDEHITPRERPLIRVMRETEADDRRAATMLLRLAQEMGEASQWMMRVAREVLADRREWTDEERRRVCSELDRRGAEMVRAGQTLPKT